MVFKNNKDIKRTTVYMCFSSDFIHNGHIEIIKKAAELGTLTIGGAFMLYD